MTQEERIKRAKEVAAEIMVIEGIDVGIEEVTCLKCLDANTCEFAFDGYNTHGYCLADK